MNGAAAMELQTIEPVAAPMTVTPPQNPATIMALAIQQGAPVETIERMWALQVAYEEREAKKAMVDAMAEFKKNPPKILKDKLVSFDGAKGRTEYMHATHFGVTSAIIAGLSEHGISHRWVTDQSNGIVGVTCILTHKLGHSESVRLEASPDASGGKNSIQAIVSAKTYLERHTLLAITGLSTADMHDDDGRGAGPADPDAAAFACRDQWIEAANKALNVSTLMRTWQMALEELDKLNRKDVYLEVHAAVGAKRAELQAATPKDHK